MAAHNHIIWDRNVLYIGYTGLLALFFKLHLPIEAVAAFQSLLSGVAAIYLYKLTYQLSGRWQAAFLATLAYVSWPDIQVWNFYIHTDALFCSVLVMYTYVLLRATHFRQLLPVLPLLLWLLLLRPNGIMVAIATFAYLLLLLRNYNAFLFKKIAGASSVLFAIILAVGFNKILHNIFSLMSVYKSGSLSGGYPALALTSAAPLYIPAASVPLWQQPFLFIGHNPVYFAKLFLLKIIVFFAQIKPYYSLAHNAAITVFIYPLYAYAVKALRQSTVTLPQRVFFLVLISMQAIAAAATLPDWDNRFIVPVLPGIFLLAAVAATARFSAQASSAVKAA